MTMGRPPVNDEFDRLCAKQRRRIRRRLMAIERRLARKLRALAALQAQPETTRTGGAVTRLGPRRNDAE